MSDFVKIKQTCESRHFNECLDRERGRSATSEKMLCDESECSKVSIGAERMGLLTRSLENLGEGQLRALLAMLCCAWPGNDLRARTWNDRVRGLLSAEIEKRGNRNHV